MLSFACRGAASGSALVQPTRPSASPGLPTGPLGLESHRVGLAGVLLHYCQGCRSAGQGGHLPRVLRCPRPGTGAGRRTRPPHGNRALRVATQLLKELWALLRCADWRCWLCSGFSVVECGETELSSAASCSSRKSGGAGVAPDFAGAGSCLALPESTVWGVIIA